MVDGRYAMEEGGNSDVTEPLVEGEDYYLDHGLMVFTERYLRRRGYCCDRGCRHCPYYKSRRSEMEDPTRPKPHF
jgi:Family of unknown function (DUF5522)